MRALPDVDDLELVRVQKDGARTFWRATIRLQPGARIPMETVNAVDDALNGKIDEVTLIAGELAPGAADARPR